MLTNIWTEIEVFYKWCKGR